jgi:hypothetical protein
MSFLAPVFLLGLAAIAVPIYVHLIQRERKDIVAFPSLMFIRRIPYQSVERRRIHNWPLLLLRLAALALIVAAFARPFFTMDAIVSAAAATGAREVVILLDRSASMGYGDHWTRAQDEARQIVADLGGDDRATLVFFDRGAEEAVRATSDAGSLNAAIGAASVSSGDTRYGPALRLAQSLLGRSDRGRLEAFLISDFQRSGWQRQEEIQLPEGATITPVQIADIETPGLAVSSVAIQRATFSGQERVTITAGLTNRGPDPVTLPVQLEIEDRLAGTREVTIAPNASGSVTFDQVTVAEANLRAVVRAGTDALPQDNTFYFVLSPSRPLSVLIVEGDQVSSNSSLYLTTALDLGKAPPFASATVAASRLTSADLDGRSLVILNDASTLPTSSVRLLEAFVERGGGLFMALGEGSPLGGDSPLVPGALAAPVERLTLRGGTFGYLDYSHPILDEFRDPRSGNFANMRFVKYRRLNPSSTDKVLARYDDGAAAIVERQVGNGRVIAFTSTLDAAWNDMPKHGMFLPLVHETVRYLSRYEEPDPWQLVGRTLDISAPVGAIVRQGEADAGLGTSAVVISPSGSQVTLGQGGAASVELTEQGFYTVRLSGSGNRRPYAVAVNLDPAESDLSALPATEFLASITHRDAVTEAGGQPLEPALLTPVEMEKQQSIWWFLLVIGLLALFAESVLSNRQSNRGLGTQ